MSSLLDRHREILASGLALSPIPDHMQEGLCAYILTGRSVGRFLTAVLMNDLKEACARADETNLQLLPEYVKVLYNYAPALCWGSQANVEAWQAHRGLEGGEF